MKVAIRVDSYAELGSGHLMRCLALAQELRVNGAQCTFITRDHSGNLNHRVIESGFGLRRLNMREEDATGFVPSLGSTVEVDAAETCEVLREWEPDWLVVDHYSLDETWESLVRVGSMRILVIDDLADRPHQCDVLLDQNFPPDDWERYRALVPPECVLVLGPRFALLHPEFALQRSLLLEHPERHRDRILVSFGASDPTALAEMSLEALTSPGLHAFPVDIVMGRNGARAEGLRTLSELRPGTRILGPQTNLAALMSTAKVSVGAGGSTLWERLCLGVSSVVVSIAPNQERICRTLGDLRLIQYLGPSNEVSPARIADACKAALLEAPSLHTDSAGGPFHVDGLGAQRVAQLMTAGS